MSARRTVLALAAFVMVLSACTPSAPSGDDAAPADSDRVAVSPARPEAPAAPATGPDAPAAAALAANPSCVPVGKKIAQGRDAVDRLGARLDTAAKRVGMSSARLRKTLLEDRYARVDECGALFYEDGTCQGLVADLFRVLFVGLAG